MQSNLIISILVISLFVTFIVRSEDETCVAETNELRTTKNLKALKVNKKLILAAKLHNDWMVSNNCFKVQCPDEPILGVRARQAGYQWSSIAENTKGGDDKNCKVVIKSWLKSNLSTKRLLGEYTHIGCTSAKCSKCDYKTYYSCVYGLPKK